MTSGYFAGMTSRCCAKVTGGYPAGTRVTGGHSTAMTMVLSSQVPRPSKSRSPTAGRLPPGRAALRLLLAAAQRDQSVDAVDLVRRARRARQQGALDVTLHRTRLDAAQLDAAAVQRDVAQLFRQRLGLRRQRHLPLAARALGVARVVLLGRSAVARQQRPEAGLTPQIGRAASRERGGKD